MRESDPYMKVPPYSIRANPQALKMALWFCSRHAIRSFTSIVDQRRQPDNTLRNSIAPSGGDTLGLHRTLYLLNVWMGNSALAKYAKRLYLVRLANIIDKTKSPIGLRVSADVIKVCMQTLGCTREALSRYLAEGRHLNTMCGDFGEALLAFLPLDTWKFSQEDDSPSGKVGPDDFRRVPPPLVSEFHRILHTDYHDDKSTSETMYSYIKLLCRSGQALSDSMEGHEEVEFNYEAGPSLRTDLTGLESEADLLHAIAPRTQLVHPIFDPARYPTAPIDWADTQWPWPVDPTTHEVHGCDFCSIVKPKTCQCFKEKFLIRAPRIKKYGQRGLGLQAVADTHGQIAFCKDARIGYITGRILPVGTGKPGWTMRLMRNDQGHNMVVGDLDTWEEGNLFRLINHSHKPTANIKYMAVSGRYIPVVVAVSDIYDGMEITISYGRGFDKFNGGSCLCEEICNHPDRGAAKRLMDLGRHT